MIVGTSVTIQIAAAIAHDLFDELGATGTSALRFSLGAVILVGLVRPALRRDATTWRSIIAYGLSLAALNLTFFEAIDRIPMGIAVTFAFIPPLVMAVLTSRRRADVGWAALAVGGVVILGGIDRPDSIAGISFALGAGLAWIGVAYAAQRVGTRTARLDGLALAIGIAAIVTLPFGLPHLGVLDPRVLALGAAIAVVGLIVPFALELQALRLLEPRIVAVVYSVDPAIGALVGLVALGEHVSLVQVAGIAAVMVAAAGATVSAAPADV